jgi:hypothetical protein
MLTKNLNEEASDTITGESSIAADPKKRKRKRGAATGQ